MKKGYIFCLLVFCTILGKAQNVGIGTLTPLVPLHVNSSTNAYEVLRLQSANTQGSLLSIWNNSERKGFLGIVDNENDFKLGTYYTGGRIQFVTEVFDVAMTILPGGNVGIGTEAPSSILDVNGAITFQAYNGAGTEGALRYNGGAFEWHDGNAWQAFSAGGNTTWSENAFGVYFSEANKRTYVGLVTGSTPLKFGVFNTDFLETSRIYHKPAVSGIEAYAQNIIADAPVAMDYDNYGSKIEILQNGSGTKYGISNRVTQNINTSRAAYGIFNNVRTLGGSSYAYATRNFVNTSTSGNSFGSHNSIIGDGTGNKYGVYSLVSGGGTKYGVYAKAEGLGTKFGVFAVATGSSSYALYASNSSPGGAASVSYTHLTLPTTPYV